MQKIRVHPQMTVVEAAREAAKRNHWLEYRGGAVYEIVPKRRRRNFDPGGPTPPAAA